MLRSLHETIGAPVLARDRRVGSVVDVYFDDARWVVRYLVVDMREELLHPEVLIPPEAIAPGSAAGQLQLLLSRQEVKNSMEASADQPVNMAYGIATAMPSGD